MSIRFRDEMSAKSEFNLLLHNTFIFYSAGVYSCLKVVLIKKNKWQKLPILKYVKNLDKNAV